MCGFLVVGCGGPADGEGACAGGLGCAEGLLLGDWCGERVSGEEGGSEEEEGGGGGEELHSGSFVSLLCFCLDRPAIFSLDIEIESDSNAVS